mmetsp:Transcript_35470/g.57041  ORF Transcript_35470/g.57041 Transcript_35470/m.57041 type:complete len:204 (-) Transcript_35470:525-1136(-)
MACLMNVASGLGATGRSTKHFTNAARRSSTTSTRRLSTRAARGRSHLVCKASAENINWSREVSTAAIRVGAGVLMVHNGLDKLVDPEGFASFVVEPFLGFLPHQEPLSYVTWTYLAAGAELAGAAGLTLGLLTRVSALSLFSTMGLAVYYHVAQSGLEGFPLAVVENHQYAFEPAALYCLIYFYFLCNGGGKLSVDNALKKDE